MPSDQLDTIMIWLFLIPLASLLPIGIIVGGTYMVLEATVPTWYLRLKERRSQRIRSAKARAKH